MSSSIRRTRKPRSSGFGPSGAEPMPGPSRSRSRQIHPDVKVTGINQFRDHSPSPEINLMPRIFWNPERDRTLRENYPVSGSTSAADLIGTTRRSVINRAHRLGLKARYPRNRARPTFPPRSWSPAQSLLAQALLDLFRSRNFGPTVHEGPNSIVPEIVPSKFLK